jgi:glycosyltransferase involved in cell wall biosynthesis
MNKISQDMPSKLPISVFIITKNEADRIKLVIDGVKDFADEILVVDSGSTDDTVKIAVQNQARVIFNDWQGYGQQKIFAQNNCKNKWILNIDADEEVSHELASEIREIFLNNLNSQFVGFKIKIVNKFWFEKKPKKYAYYYNQLRLYNVDFAGFKDSAVHDSVILKNPNDQNKISQLKNIIHHQSIRSYQHWVEKINNYSSMQALDSFNKKKQPTILKIILTPSIAFFKAYFIRRYFIYGFDGIFFSYLFSFSRLVKMVKTRELFRSQSQSNKLY